MHELGLTQSILDIAVEHAVKNGAAKISQVNVKAGKMTAIVEDSMQFFFEYLAGDTIAAGAQLVIEHVPIVIRCLQCGKESEVEQLDIYTCPHCGEHAVELVSGREFFVDSIEVE